jgi:hypothetical protein
MKEFLHLQIHSENLPDHICVEQEVNRVFSSIGSNLKYATFIPPSHSTEQMLSGDKRYNNETNSLSRCSHFYRVGMRNISDYSPFGVLLSERTTESAFYRQGFQGQERDDEVRVIQ